MEVLSVRRVLGHPGGERDARSGARPTAELLEAEALEHIRQPLDTVVAVHAVHADDELVAAPPPDHVLATERLDEQRCQALERRVPGGVPEAVVEGLEGIEIEDRQRERLAEALAHRGEVFEDGCGRAAIGGRS